MRDRGAIRPQAAGLAFERLYKVDQTGAFWTLQHAKEMWGRQPLLLLNSDGTVEKFRVKSRKFFPKNCTFTLFEDISGGFGRADLPQRYVFMHVSGEVESYFCIPPPLA